MGNWILIGLVVLLILIIIFAKFYQRSSKDVAFVRTGLGGERIVLTGGRLAIPIFHQVTPVNMNTLRLDVERAEAKALVTKDRMRVDLHAVFYVRVVGTKEGVALAAQTLGSRTLNAQSIQDLLQGKFVDAMRSVAASMTLDDLHEQGNQFVERVAVLVRDVVTHNGLELESVSLSSMDQTSKEFFDPSNTFDAEGLVKITRETEESRKTRNEIQKNTELKIQQTNLETEEKSLEIKRQSEYAKLETDRDISKRRAEQATEVSDVQILQRSRASEVEISENERIEKIRLASEQEISRERISNEQIVRSAEIEKSKNLEIADIDRQTSLKVAEEERNKKLLTKQKERSLIEAETSEAAAKAASAEEEISTSRETARAEREKSISIIKATRLAEEKAIAARLAAEAEKVAASDIAAAKEIIANAEASAERVKLLAEAEGQTRINEASNLLSDAQIDMKIKLNTIQQLPDMIKESVKPLENIEGIRIVDIGGLGLEGNMVSSTGSGPGGSTESQPSGGGSGDLVDRAVTGALRYRAQAPVVDALLHEVGLTTEEGEGLAALASGTSPLVLGKKIKQNSPKKS